MTTEKYFSFGKYNCVVSVRVEGGRGKAKYGGGGYGFLFDVH